MLSNYAWLMVYGDIDDPSVEENGGDVYIHQDDVIGNEKLCRGNVVTFYLYIDEEGLGAEGCRVEQSATSPFKPDAAHLAPKESIASCSWATALSRMQKVFNDISFDEEDESFLVPQGPPKAFAFNEDSCDEDVITCVPKEPSGVHNEKWSDEEDVRHKDVIDAGKSWQVGRFSISEISTDDGSSGVSEEENLSGKADDSEEDDTTEKILVSPPVKKSLPPNFRPPPGLSLPPWRRKAWLCLDDSS